ncbi:hypothetical protein OUZ56_009895 [Daphnia magna]|uniref:Uncharacterized protein n=1 Tax=Daphnia magna TaxID=35525 RepID=A0ABR0AH75_9CRUS|nr:hypothetical protein OUZ56_009895 [Daphnia magna]
MAPARTIFIWIEITKAVHQVVKKKLLNLIGAAKPSIRNYVNGLTETGKSLGMGGTIGVSGVLRSSYFKYYQEVLDHDNPCVAATAIEGSIDTEIQTTDEKQQQLVSTQILGSTKAKSTIMNYFDEEDDSLSLINRATKLAEEKTRNYDTSANNKEGQISLCGLGETSANSRFTDQRLRVLKSTMNVWEMLKDSVQKSELPENLLDLLYNLASEWYVNQKN